MYGVSKLLTSDQKILMQDYVYGLKFKHHPKFYNLHNIYKADDRGPEWFLDIFRREYDREVHSSYFLRYVEGSWTRAHRDPTHEMDTTVVTMLVSEDLVGGESLVFEQTHRVQRFTDREIDTYDKPVVIPNFEEGESLMYTTEVKHAVAKVHSGHRVVHIVWLRRPDKGSD